jgi:putative ABC transport system ATP-binding protein
VPDRFLAVEHAGVSYRTGKIVSPALRDVSLEFDPGQLTLVMGPSGSGKTTLLSLLGCLLTPDTGSVYLRGAEASRMSQTERTRLRRESIGFIFQAFRLFHALTALENVALAGEIDGRSAARRQARELLARLGLEAKARLKPNELSGGEKQRVAIARALLRNPAILLADEPTSSLDSNAGREIGEILVSLAERERRTVVVVSHDPRWAPFAHRIVTLEDGQVMGDRKGAR